MDGIAFIVVAAIIIWIWTKTGMISASSTYSKNEMWKPSTTSSKVVPKWKRIQDREFALKRAKPFLKPYTDIMGSLCLANENCRVNLFVENNGEKTLVCLNKKVENGKRAILTAKINQNIAAYYSYPPDYVVDNIFNILCANFAYSTSYANILAAVNQGMLLVQESSVAANTTSKETQKVYDSVSNTQIRTNNLLNINTATEAELLALPGINIVIAKKIIKYIERNGEFKSVDEFIEKFKIKDIFAEQIKQLACAKYEDISDSDSSKETPQNGIGLDIMESSNQSELPHSQNERIIDL